jgi:plasmid segregation protein ParM
MVFEKSTTPSVDDASLSEKVKPAAVTPEKNVEEVSSRSSSFSNSASEFFSSSNKNNNQSIGIDLGYGFVKMQDGPGELVFPSVVGIGKEIKFFSGMIKKDVKTDNISIVYDGQRYFVGDLAMRQSDIASRGLSQDRVNDSNYKIIMLAALGLMAKAEEETFSIVTGLPTNYFGAYRDELRKSIVGEYEFLYGQKDQEKKRKIKIQDAYIVPQPFGTLYNEILGDNGETVNKDFNSENIGIVDIGFKTSDFAVSNQMEYIDHMSFSTMRAMSDVYSIISDNLLNEHKIEKENFELDRIVSEGVVRIAGQKIDISELKKRTFGFVASKIVTELQSQWNYRDFDAILLTGGGGKALSEYILPHFSNMRLVEQPQHSNVRGFQKIANRVFKA